MIFFASTYDITNPAAANFLRNVPFLDFFRFNLTPGRSDDFALTCIFADDKNQR